MRIRITEIGALLQALRGFTGVARGAAEARSVRLVATSSVDAGGNEVTGSIVATDTGDWASMVVAAAVEIPGEATMLAEALALLLERVTRGAALLAVSGRRVTLSQRAGGFWRAVGTTMLVPAPLEPEPSPAGGARPEALAGDGLPEQTAASGHGATPASFAERDPLAKILGELGIVRLRPGSAKRPSPVPMPEPGLAARATGPGQGVGRGLDSVAVPATALAPKGSPSTASARRTFAFGGPRVRKASDLAAARVPTFRRAPCASAKPARAATAAAEAASAPTATLRAPRTAASGRTRPVPARPAEALAAASPVPNVNATARVSLSGLREALRNVVFSGVRYTAGESIGVTVSATSLCLVGVDEQCESSVKVVLDATGSGGAGTWGVSGPVFKKAIRDLGKGSDQVLVAFEGDAVMLSTSSSTAPVRLPATFGKSPKELAPVRGKSFRTERLAEVLRRAATVITTQGGVRDPSRWFAGVLVDGDVVVATDGRRLHRYQLGEKLPRMHLPSEHVLKVLGRIGAVDGVCGKDTAAFTAGPITIIAAIDDRYPTYAQHFEGAAECPFVLPLTEALRQDWRQKLKDMPVPESQAVCLRLNGRIEMSSQDGRGAVGRAVVDAALTRGQEVQLFLSKRYLDNLLQEPVTSLLVRGPSTAVIAEGDGMGAVVMPVDPEQTRRRRRVKAAA